MKKLFKEVWKSFSKSKIILAGLTLLVFLTSGIITLIFDVYKTYNSQYNDYKRTSQLQDVTLNSNIEPTGSKPQNLYTNEVKNIWKHVNPKNNYINSIRINTDDDYYNISSLINSNSPLYVSVKDLSSILNMNLHSLNNIQPSDGSSEATISLTKDSRNILKLYDSNGTLQTNKITNVSTIYKRTGSDRWSAVANASDLIDGTQFKSLLIDSTNSKAYIWNDVNKREGILGTTTTDIYKEYVDNPDKFYFVDSDTVAKWFGFNKENLVSSEYIFNLNFNEWIVDENFPQTAITLEELRTKKIKDNFDININNAIGDLNSSNKNFVELPSTINLNNTSLTMKIPISWFVYSQDTYIYTKHTYKLAGIENNEINNSWSGIYKNYLEELKINNPSKFNEIIITSYWSKDIQNILVDYYGNIIQQVDSNNNSTKKENVVVFENITLSDEDLKYKIESEDGNISTIAELEGIIESDINQEIATKINTNKVASNEATIENESLNLAYKNIYQEIKNITGKIGIRENITINSNDSNSNNVYQFINLGNENNELDWNGIKISQEVGKLSNTDLSSPIFTLKSNINAHENSVPIANLPNILDKLLTGLSLNRNYINPMISFENFSYQNPDDLWTSQTNAKIIWLTPEDDKHNRNKLVGLSTIRNNVDGTKEYFFLKENDKQDPSVTTHWIATNRFATYEEMSSYILSHNLNFAPFGYYYGIDGNTTDTIQVVSDLGWAKQNTTYIDQFSISFQYLLPDPEIIEGFNNGEGMKLFKENLIKNMTNEVKSIIDATTWSILMEAIDYAFTEYGFGTGLTPPAEISNLVIEKLIIGTIARATELSNQAFLNTFLTNVLLGIKREMLKAGDTTAQNAYLLEQIKKIGIMLQMTVGFSLPTSIDSLIQNMNGSDLIDGLIGLINSINVDNLILELFDKVYNNPSRPTNQIVASGDYYPLIYKNITNTNAFKSSLIKVIKSLNIDLSNVIPGIDVSNILSLLTVTNPIEGYTVLSNQAVMKYNAEYDVYYSSISLVEFLNMFQAPIFGGLGSLIESFAPGTLPVDADIMYSRTTMNPLELDMDQLWYFDNYVFANGTGNIFGIDSQYTLNQAVTSFTIVREDNNQITYTENAGKIAIVNEAFLKSNNKEVYESSTLENDLNDLSKIDDKYKIKVSNVEYVIIGSDISVDYIYPVINSENITVNTKNQALVYVNQYGYDRIRRSNVNSPTDKYFLIQSKSDISSATTQTLLNQLVYEWSTGGGFISAENANSDSNIYKKAYLATESSLLNPERSLRITIIDKLLDTLSKVQLYVGVFLIILTSIVISFVVRRYISSRAKVLGILKAQGYSSFEIAISICLFSLIVSLIGGTLGYIVGHFAQYGMFDLLSLIWTIPIATASFNWLTLVITVFAPFILLSILTIIITIWFLRKKSLSLMNGSLEVNNSRFAKDVRKIVTKTSIKNRFSINVALGSIGRLVALFISMLFTSSVTLFAIVSYRIFNKSVDRTFKERNYTYKIDLTSPTIEGGNYYNFQINNSEAINVDNMLYVPVGSTDEAYTYLANYFKPGFNSVINVDLEIGNGILKPANGTLLIDDETTPHIFTKSSIDLTVNAGGLSINVWNNLYNTIPESQRASIISSSDKAARWLEWTQEGKEYNGTKYITRFMNFGTENEYLTLFDPETNQNYQIFNNLTGKMEDKRISYFNYISNETNPENSYFSFRETNSQDNSKYYDSKLIINGRVEQNLIRYYYRQFLVDGYNKMFNFQNTNHEQKYDFEPTTMPEFALDYFLMPGAIMLNNNSNNQLSYVDETYIYVNTQKINQKDVQPTLYAYDENSNFVKIIDSHGNNLLLKINNYLNGEYKPLIINHVVSQKYGLNVNDVIELEIQNRLDRYQTSLINKIENKISSNPTFKFKVVAISDTYINEEWITNKSTAKEILGLNDSKQEYYNGVFSQSSAPIQLSNSLSLYAYNGYWSATESIENTDPSTWSESEKDIKLKTYQQLFYLPNSANLENNSLLANHIRYAYRTLYNQELTNEEVNNKIKILLGLNESDSLDFIVSESQKIYNALEVFISIYSNKSLQASLINAVSNGVEKDYINVASSTINDGMLIVLTISFAISLAILIMITTMIINENERNIAIFGILGYSTKEKIRMFFSIYIPIVVLSLLLSILIVWLIIPTFSSAILATSSIALPLGLSILHVLYASAIVISIFSITCILAWIIQGRIKPIILLKGV